MPRKAITMENWQAEVIGRLQESENTINEMRKTQDTLLKRIHDNETLIKEYRELLTAKINDTDTKLVIETAKREIEIRNIRDTIDCVKTTSEICKNSTQEKQPAEMMLPTFSGNNSDAHPKQYLKDLEIYIQRKRIPKEDECIIIGNSLKGRATSWYTMIKDATPDFCTFKNLFLKHFFSDKKQWDIFIQCTEAGKTPIKSGYQAHFHKWMTELKYLDTPKITEEQGIKLVIKHFPIAIQAFLEGSTEKHFLNVWEKLDEIEDHQIVKGSQPNNVDINQDRKQQHINPYNQERRQYQGHHNRQNDGGRTRGNVQQLNVERESEDDDDQEENNDQKNWCPGTVEMTQLQ